MHNLWERIKSTLHERPWLWGVIIFVLGVGVIWYMRRGGGGSADSGGVPSGYYSAAAAATASGNQLAATQIAAQAATVQSNNQLAGILAEVGAKKDVDIKSLDTSATIAKAATDAQVQMSTLTERGLENTNRTSLEAHLADVSLANTLGANAYYLSAQKEANDYYLNHFSLENQQAALAYANGIKLNSNFIDLQKEADRHVEFMTYGNARPN